MLGETFRNILKNLHSTFIVLKSEMLCLIYCYCCKVLQHRCWGQKVLATTKPPLTIRKAHSNFQAQIQFIASIQHKKSDTVDIKWPHITSKLPFYIYDTFQFYLKTFSKKVSKPRFNILVAQIN